ncbi:MAG: uroporphyrinogen-III C-methyltransferase [Acetobacteraceae bacterium]
MTVPLSASPASATPAFAPPTPAAAPPALTRAGARLRAPAFAPGTVWLVGAGPGDPGLLTLHAAHALAVADVVLHDALVAPEILDLAATPRLEAVGKRAGGVRTAQLRINQRLIVLARRGLRVLRLKGGDPLVFGRGGEEALALVAAGIPFRIVPGISAGIGGAAAAGIPLTHRGLARSVTFVTGRDAHGVPGQDAHGVPWQDAHGMPEHDAHGIPGHDTHGVLPAGLDPAALARGADVLVLYMALREAGPIAAALIAAGRAADESVVFLAEATTPRQRVTYATLATAGAVAAALPRAAPTLIVIGPVLALGEVLAPLLQAAPMTLAPQPAVVSAPAGPPARAALSA